MLLTKENTLNLVDTQAPNNIVHPHGFGRLAWWLALPATSGGQYLYDLMGLHTGTLQGASWGTSSRPGGVSQLNFASSYVSIPSITLAGDFTIAFWEFFPAGTSLDSTYCALGSSGATINHGSGNIRLTIGGSDAIASGNSTPTGAWCRYVITRIGTSYAIYLNGAVDTTTTATATSFSLSGIGYNGATGTAGGAMDDLLIWTRGLSPVEIVQELYLSTHVYPGVLNRANMRFGLANGSQYVGMTGGSMVTADASVSHSNVFPLGNFFFG